MTRGILAAIQSTILHLSFTYPEIPKTYSNLYVEILDTHKMKLKQNNVRKSVALRRVSVTTVAVKKQ